MIRILRIGTATVWIAFGAAKLFDLVPRHRKIVAAVLGESAAGPVTRLIGGAEVGLGLWILSGVRPRTCAATQTVAIATMNALELRMARDLLLAPVPMVCANIAFLAAGWACALDAHARK